MSVSNLWCHEMEAERNVNYLRNCLPEKLETLCKMHLIFVLDSTGKEFKELFSDSSSKHQTSIKKKFSTPFSKKKESRQQMGDRFLSQDRVARIGQLLEFLQRPENMKTEGLFRKTGNVTRQRLLKEWVNQCADLNLDDGTFSPHDCATVLKSCISELTEPLLTEKHFEAHCQIVDMSKNVISGGDRSKVKDNQLKALQLLFLLMPRQNAVLLKCVLDLLHKVSNISDNRMNANSLGMVFAPSLICPKKLTPLEFQSKSDVCTKAVSFMVENAPFLFKIPRELAEEVGNFLQEMKDHHKNVITEESGHRNVPLNTKFNCANGYSASKRKHSRSHSFGDSLKKCFPLLKQHNAFREEVESCGMALSQGNKKIDDSTVHNFDNKTCAEMPQTPMVPNASNTTWEAENQHSTEDWMKDSIKDLPTDLIFNQKEEYYGFKVALKKKICLVAQQKPTGDITLGTEFIKRPQKSTKVTMMTPRPRKYLESDL